MSFSLIIFIILESVSDVVKGRYGNAPNELIYAIFTTPQNAIPGSAVCAFSMRDILDTFDGPFKEQKDLSSNWLPVPQHEVSIELVRFKYFLVYI